MVKIDKIFVPLAIASFFLGVECGHVELALIQTAAKPTPTSIGATVPLEEWGYRQVVEANNRVEMKKFLSRLLNVSNKTFKGPNVNREADFEGAVTWFTKNGGSQSFQDVKDALVKKDWVWDKGTIGVTASLDENGYEKVIAAWSREGLKKFMMRILKENNKTFKGPKSNRVADFEGAVTWFKDNGASQDFRALTEALLNADWVWDNTPVSTSAESPLADRPSQPSPPSPPVADRPARPSPPPPPPPPVADRPSQPSPPPPLSPSTGDHRHY